jgi:hypothetical protein
VPQAWQELVFDEDGHERLLQIVDATVRLVLTGLEERPVVLRINWQSVVVETVALVDSGGEEEGVGEAQQPAAHPRPDTSPGSKQTAKKTRVAISQETITEARESRPWLQLITGEDSVPLKTTKGAWRCRCLLCCEYFSANNRKPSSKLAWALPEGASVYDTADLDKHIASET